MNHLGDANKMVRETPRTDAVWELFATDTTLEPDVEFSTLARQLERELNAANQRIKRLENVENSHADVLKAIGNWIKQQEAKEAKP